MRLSFGKRQIPEPTFRETLVTSAYRCACFAVPSKLLRKLAEKAGDADRRKMHSHLETTARLRTQRTAWELPPEIPMLFEAPAAKKEKTPPYRRTIFDVGTDTRLPGRSVRVEGGKPVRDKAVNQVYDNTGITLDFFLKVFGRHSLDDRGMPVESAVHYGDHFSNAMWTGEQMVYGDGDQHVGGFTQALDIIAHELTHGVVQHMVPGGLGAVRLAVKDREFEGQTHALKGQSGALNESFSDVFGSMVKQWHAQEEAGQANWLLGENMLAPHYGKAIRSLKDPGNRKLTWYEDDQFKTMAQYIDGADVHDSSGIPSHAFYLTAKKIGGFSWETAGPIWYHAMSRLHSRASFADAAKATKESADSLFGSKSKESSAVAAAWKTVKVSA